MNVNLKKVIEEILKKREFDKLKHFDNVRRVLSSLISFLYGEELFVFRSSEAIGFIAGWLEDREPETVIEIIRRMFWYMNEENGGYCPAAPLVIGEIGRNVKEVFKDFINPTISLLDNPEIEKTYALYAIGRIGVKIMNTNIDIASKLSIYLKSPNPQVRGHTAWTVGQLKLKNLTKQLYKLLQDDDKFRIYLDGDFRELAIREIASKSIEEILKAT
ncbi:MAG: hypothetical protein QXX82_06485 [Nitrososphaerota archaeon]